MKRFYKVVSTKKSPNGFDILLDGKPINTPLKNTLSTTSEALADEILKEWAAQKDKIIPGTMPFTQILSTKIDRVSNEREMMQEGALKYFNTDLLCYRTDDPPEMAAAQSKSWDPVLDWFSARFKAGIKTTTAIAALQQPENLHAAVREYVEALDDDHFTILQLATASVGSLILAIALVEKHLSATQVFGCALVEERFKAKVYNEEKYGPDPAQEKKDQAMLLDLKSAEDYLKFITA